MNIYESISAVMQEGYAIGKDKRNDQQHFLYRGIDDVMNTFQPLLSKYKIFVVPEVLNAQREERQTIKGGNLIYSVLTIRYTFYAEDGSSVSAVVIGEGMDSGDKASNKAMAVGMKYAMFQTFCIPTEEMRDDDPDRTTPEPTTRKKTKPDTPQNNVYQIDDIKFSCGFCKKTLTPLKCPDGSIMSIREYVSRTTGKFGQPVCLSCIREHYPDNYENNGWLLEQRNDPSAN